ELHFPDEAAIGDSAHVHYRIMSGRNRLGEDELARGVGRVGPHFGYERTRAAGQSYTHALEVHLATAFGQADSTRKIGSRAHGEHDAGDIACDGEASGPISLRTAGVHVAEDSILAGRGAQVKRIVRRSG